MTYIVVPVPPERLTEFQQHMQVWLASAPGAVWTVSPATVEPPGNVRPWSNAAGDADSNRADASQIWKALGPAERLLLDRLQTTTRKYEHEGKEPAFRAEAEAEQLAIMCGVSGPMAIAQSAGAIEVACKAVGRETCLEIHMNIDSTTLSFKEPARIAFLHLAAA